MSQNEMRESAQNWSDSIALQQHLPQQLSHLTQQVQQIQQQNSAFHQQMQEQHLTLQQQLSGLISGLELLPNRLERLESSHLTLRQTQLDLMVQLKALLSKKSTSPLQQTLKEFVTVLSAIEQRQRAQSESERNLQTLLKQLCSSLDDFNATMNRLK